MDISKIVATFGGHPYAPPLGSSFVTSFSSSSQVDIGTGPNRVAVVYALGLWSGDAVADRPLTFTIGSVTLTPGTLFEGDYSGYSRRIFYGDVSSITGNQTATVTYADNKSNVRGFAGIIVRDADTTTVIDNIATIARGVNTMPISIDVPNGTGKLACVLFFNTNAEFGTFTPDANTTMISGVDVNSASRMEFVWARNGGTPSTISGSFTAPVYGEYAGFNILPAPAVPTLNSESHSVTGSTTATIGATTDTGSGTLYGVVTTSATPPSAAQVLAGQNDGGTAAVWSGNAAVSSIGAKTLNATGLTANTAYYGYLCQTGPSNVLPTATFTTFATPSLSNPTGTTTGPTTADGSVDSNVTAGTLYRLASTNATELAATVKAAALTTTVTSSGTQNVSFTGLTGSTTYYAHYVLTDGSSVNSTRVSSSSFTTTDGTVPTLTGTVTISNIAQTTATFTWPAGSDNVGVTGYEYRLNAGSYVDAGLVLTIGVTGLSAGTGYTVDVRAYDAINNKSSIISGTFTTLHVAPSVSVQPTNQTVTAPAAATFSATITGSAVSYQWQRQPNGGGGYVNVVGGSGGTTNSYTTPATSTSGGNANHGDTYRLVATNTGGSVTTNVVTLTVNAGADTTPPVLVGSITPSLITTSSYTLSWPAASDNVAVTGYEVSIDNGLNYVDKGLVLTCNISGRSPGTTDQVKVRAYDAGGNRSQSLSTTIGLTNTSVTTQIISNGSGTPMATTLLHYTFWPAGRIGAMTGVTPMEGTVTTASNGTATIAGFPLGLGVLELAYYATGGTINATTDKVYYEAVTVV
jgi:hypothetical protein